MDQWLVRTVGNQILGPMTKDAVLTMITEHKLQSEDEVCGARGYWFSLHERDETKKWLGIEALRSAKVGGDPDATDSEITAPQIELSAVQSQATLTSPPKTPPPTRPSNFNPPSKMVVRSGPKAVEQPSLVKGMTWLLIAFAAMILAAVVRLLRTSGI